MGSLFLGPFFLGRQLEILGGMPPWSSQMLACAVVAAVLLAIWILNGLSPACQRPGAERRHRIGHMLTAATSALAAIIIGRPFFLDLFDDYNRASSADWYMLFTGVAASPFWTVGLLLIWTSYGTAQQEA